MADTPDSLAATLDKIRERAEELTIGEDQEDHCGAGTPCTGHDAIRLVAALDAVLKLHEPDPADPSWCRDCAFAWPCSTYRAITAELTKGEPGDG